MNNFLIIPIITPLFTGIILMFFKNNLTLQKWISLFSLLFVTISAFLLGHQVYENGIQTIQLGNWNPPYGIVFVADMFSILLVITTSIISLICLVYSFQSIEKERGLFYFYSFFHFLITGVFGAFLTGDIFNLFVFFEVMLMSSYALLVLGGTKIQFRESIKYLLVNIVSSALFVMAVGFLYATTGTLNMAHLSVRVAEVGQHGVITVIAIFLLIVFGLKGAIFPLFFWLPGAYISPPPVVTAMFGALLTKVGIYSIFRVLTLIFYHEQAFTHRFLSLLAALTVLSGVIGAIAHNDIFKILVYNIITAVGVITIGISIFTPDAISGALFYLIHDMIIKASLFLLAGTIMYITKTDELKKLGGLIHDFPLLGWLFFVASLALAGIPPLSGFIGKLLIIRGAVFAGNYWIIPIVLGSSLLVLYSVMKIFMHGFWGTKQTTYHLKGTIRGLVAPCMILVILSIFLGVFAESLFPYIDLASKQLLNPEQYIDSVLKE